jgi:hypothetical protein
VLEKCRKCKHCNNIGAVLDLPLLLSNRDRRGLVVHGGIVQGVLK